MTSTHTRTHVYVTFANPYLVCRECHQTVPRWHDAERCGCDAGSWNMPCEHNAGVVSVCPSWGPVDDCTCVETLGFARHQVPDEDGRVDMLAHRDAVLRDHPEIRYAAELAPLMGVHEPAYWGWCLERATEGEVAS